MKYCTECGAEYRDTAEACSDCPSSELVSRDEMHRRGLQLAAERDTRKFVPAGNADDPLTKQALVKALESEKIPVFARPRSGGSVGPLTGPAREWWELLVPEDLMDRARGLIDSEKERMRATEQDAARAAEEEAMAEDPTQGS